MTRQTRDWNSLDSLPLKTIGHSLELAEPPPEPVNITYCNC